MRITHFLAFEDEAVAVAALPDFRDGDDWRRDMVDGPVPIMAATGATVPDDFSGAPVPVMALVSGYHLNISLPDLDVTLPGLMGAGYGSADDFALVHGAHPITPQRVFA